MCSLNHTLVPSVAPPTCRASFSNIKGIILQFYSQLWFNEPVKWSPTKCGWRKFIALSISGSSYWQSCVTSLEQCHLSKHHEFSEFAFMEKQHFCTFWPRWHNLPSLGFMLDPWIFKPRVWNMTSPSLMASVVSLKVSDVPSNRASRNVRRGQGAARQNCHLTSLKPRETHKKYTLEHKLKYMDGRTLRQG